MKKTVLQKGCYCVVKDPVDKKGKCQLGKEQLRVGISSFFLHPGEMASSLSSSAPAIRAGTSL